MSCTSRIRHSWTRLRISTKTTSTFTRSFSSTSTSTSTSTFASTSTSTSSTHWRALLVSSASLTGLAYYFHSSIHCQGSDIFTTASPDGSPPPLPTPTPPPSIFEAAQASRASLDGMSTSDERGISFEKLCKPSTGRPLIVLVACGSFSPITNLHLLLFEQAKNRLMWDTNEFDVVGGILSPVHDAYGKTSLIPANHRLEMCKRALTTSDWISMSSWETLQSGWTPTAEVLCKYQAAINNSELYHQPVRVKLLCGADLLESVLVPGLWSKPDLDLILGTFGVACLERTGKNCAQLIADNPILAQYAHNIHIIPQTITNDISSTSVRYCIQRNLSVKYLIPDNVADYIYENALYGHDPHRQKQAHVLPDKSPKRICGCTCNTCGCSTKSAL